MKTYKVTLIKRWESIVQAKDGEMACDKFVEDVEPVYEELKEELVGPDTAFEYRVRVVEDQGEYEHFVYNDEDDRRFMCKQLDHYGLCGVITERREAGTQGEWKDHDSCFGFIASPDGVDFVIKYARDNLPEGCTAKVVSE